MGFMFPILLWIVIGTVIGGTLLAAWSREKKRREAIVAFAEQLGLKCLPALDAADQGIFDGFKLAQRGRDQKSSNVIVADSGQLRMVVFDYSYVTGSGKNRSTTKQSVVLASAATLQTPSFELSPESFFHRIAEFFGYNDIDFDEDPEFSQAFLLYGGNEAEVRKFFNAKRRKHLCQTPQVLLEAAGSNFILFRSGKLLKAEEVTQLMDEALAMFQLLSESE